MNETMKKIAAIVFAVVAVGAVVFMGFKLFAPTPLEQGVVHPSPAKSMAQMEKERMQREDAAAAKGKGAAAEGDGSDPEAALAGKR